MCSAVLDNTKTSLWDVIAAFLITGIMFGVILYGIFATTFTSKIVNKVVQMGAQSRTYKDDLNT